MLKWLLKSLLVIVVFVPFALSLGESVPHAGRRDVLVLDGAVELLFLGAAVQPAFRRPVASGGGSRAPVARGERRAAGQVSEGDGLDVRRSILVLPRGVPAAVRRPQRRLQQGVAPGRDILAVGSRVGLEKAAWIISRAARSFISTPAGA